MPKFRAVKVVVRVFETFADSPEQGQEFILRWQNDDREEPEGGIKATSYKMGFEEFNDEPNEVIQGRNAVLAAFLDLMQNKIEGYPKGQAEAQRHSGLVHPFTLELVDGRVEVRDAPESQGEKGDRCPHCGTPEGQAHKQGCPASGGLPLTGPRPLAT